MNCLSVFDHFVGLALKGLTFSSATDFSRTNPAGIYLFKANNGKTKSICEICSRFPIKTP